MNFNYSSVEGKAQAVSMHYVHKNIKGPLPAWLTESAARGDFRILRTGEVILYQRSGVAPVNSTDWLIKIEGEEIHTCPEGLFKALYKEVPLEE